MKLLSFIVFISLLTFAQANAPEPVWWSSGVIDSNSSNPADNWAMANVGQLKNIATKARAHLDTTLGTTQGDWDAAYAPDACPLPFSAAADPDNFSPVNVGQLKFVAAGFYRLLHAKAPAYNVSARLQALGVPSSGISGSGPYFPWSSATGTGENYDAATIGQLKLAFAFDLATLDSDGDGLPDGWENAHGLNPVSGADAALDGDGDGLSNLQEYAAGTNPNAADTDGDGMKDGRELLYGRNPRKGAVSDTAHAVDLKVFQPTR